MTENSAHGSSAVSEDAPETHDAQEDAEHAHHDVSNVQDNAVYVRSDFAQKGVPDVHAPILVSENHTKGVKIAGAAPPKPPTHDSQPLIQEG